MTEHVIFAGIFIIGLLLSLILINFLNVVLLWLFISILIIFLSEMLFD